MKALLKTILFIFTGLLIVWTNCGEDKKIRSLLSMNIPRMSV